MSKAKIVFTRDPNAAVRFVDVVKRNRDTCGREPVPAVLRPFDEGDGAVEVRLQVPPLLGIEPRDPVEVEVGDGGLAPRSDGRS